MRLVFSGSWFDKDGLWEARIRRLHKFESLEDLEHVDFGFLLISYGFSSQTLGIKVKASEYPRLVFLELDEPSPFVKHEDSLNLRLLSSSFDEKNYTEAVKKVKEFIAEGTIYQLNLTCKFDFEMSGKPIDLFLRYYKSQPVPYAFFLDLEDFYLVCGSMELFLEKRGKKVVSKPIKGTAQSREELLKSQKDRAENLMITDMVRNDLSRVALRCSVKVEELFSVEEFRTLFQMHSTVLAQTEENVKNILMATFPPASVVGAPKRKAVELIDLLEPHPRDYYCGCAGFVFGGDFTLCVLIRTAIGSGNKLSYYAGAGIVWDSLPEKEWREVLLKTKAFCETLMA